MEGSINSVERYVSRITFDYKNWNTTTFPWFRGEPKSATPLVPKLYRSTKDGRTHNENRLLQHFRMKAPVLGSDFIPDRGAIDEWLFLAQHVGLPTRLLDWSEGALVALYFALLQENPVVWMLDPVELNRQSAHDPIGDNVFPLTWFRPEDGRLNIGHENIRGAWETDHAGFQLPVAVHPTNIHPRMAAQHSCFTVHGKLKQSLSELVGDRILMRYEIDPESSEPMKRELRMMGVSHSSLFPDLDGLSRDLASVF